MVEFHTSFSLFILEALSTVIPSRRLWNRVGKIGCLANSQLHILIVFVLHEFENFAELYCLLFQLNSCKIWACMQKNMHPFAHQWLMYGLIFSLITEHFYALWSETCFYYYRHDCSISCLFVSIYLRMACEEYKNSIRIEIKALRVNFARSMFFLNYNITCGPGSGIRIYLKQCWVKNQKNKLFFVRFLFFRALTI